MHAFARLALITSVAAAFAIAACGGTVVVDDDEGGSGGGGASSSTSTNTSPSNSSSSTGVPTTVTSSSSSSSGPISTSTGPCQTCADAVTNGQLPAASVCPGQSQQFYDALVSCICAEVCAGACSDTVCIGNGFSDVCASCLQTSCVKQLNDCVNDT